MKYKNIKWYKSEKYLDDTFFRFLIVKKLSVVKIDFNVQANSQNKYSKEYYRIQYMQQLRLIKINDRKHKIDYVLHSMTIIFLCVIVVLNPILFILKLSC